MKPKDLRIKILDSVMDEKEGHIGGSFSCIEILICLYDSILTKNDKFILSKGHSYQVLYHILKEKGYNPKLKGHPDIDIKNGLECTTGSLGHGLPIAVGMALAKKLKNEPGIIYVLLSDGELQEGTTWESLLIASHHKLDNLTIIIDRNKLQALDFTDKVTSLDNIRKKIKAFNCDCIELLNGHDMKTLLMSMKIKPIKKPKVIIANTIKGKGVSFMENNPSWHARIPTQDEYDMAIKELL